MCTSRMELSSERMRLHKNWLGKMLKKSLKNHAGFTKTKSGTLRLRKPAIFSAKICKTNVISIGATSASLSCDLCQGEATAQGIKAKKGTIRIFANVVGAQLKAATLGGSAVDIGVGVEVGSFCKSCGCEAFNVQYLQVEFKLEFMLHLQQQQN